MTAVSYTGGISHLTDEKASIPEQEERIGRYAKEHGIEITRRYDDFDELLRDGISRKFDLVVLDSVYTAGKDLFTAREVLAYTFHPAGIDFQCASDGFDSEGKTEDELKQYFRKAVRRRMSEMGKGRIAGKGVQKSRFPYGYRLEDGQVCVDRKQAEVIRRIFSLRLSGKNTAEIAFLLSEEGAATPAAEKGSKNAGDRWNTSRVAGILRTERYAGEIVERDIFEEVQKQFPKKRIGKTGQRGILAGLVHDAATGYPLKSLKRKDGYKYAFAEKRYNPGYRSGHGIYSEFVEKKILAAVEREQQTAARMADILEKHREILLNAALAPIREGMRGETLRLSEAEAKKMAVYLEAKAGKGTEEEYALAEAEALTVLHETEAAIAGYMRQAEEMEIVCSVKNPWLKRYLSWKAGKGMPENMTMKNYVSDVLVEDFRKVTFIPKEQEWREKLLKEIRKTLGEETAETPYTFEYREGGSNGKEEQEE